MTATKDRSSEGRPLYLHEILEEMNRSGKFRVSVLSSTEGLPIATAPQSYDSDLASTMVALLQQVSSDAQSQLGMAPIDEVTIRDHENLRLVCRRVVAGGEELILAALVPPNTYYRRVTNRAVKQIKESLS